MSRTQKSHWAGGRAVAAIRQTRPADQAALSDFFAGLSARTRYLRFFGPVTPGPALLRSLIGDADHCHTDAVVAIRGDVIIGHAMAADQADRDGPEGAWMTDIGVVVGDDWQGRGVGSALVRALITGAQARGVASVVMEVLPGNRQVLAMITGHWPAASICHSTDYVTVRIQLARQQPHLEQGAPARPVPWLGPDRVGARGKPCDRAITLPQPLVPPDPFRRSGAV
jgi:ribosomal protein S18 acetylase RimI-like enzyme